MLHQHPPLSNSSNSVAGSNSVGRLMTSPLAEGRWSLPTNSGRMAGNNGNVNNAHVAPNQTTSLHGDAANSKKVDFMQQTAHLKSPTSFGPSKIGNCSCSRSKVRTAETSTAVSSSFNGGENKPSEVNNGNAFWEKHFRTKMCPFLFGDEKKCARGQRCSYAHSLQSLRSRPDLAKTKLCDAYMKGLCSNKNCKWAHGRHELRHTNEFYKTSLCKYWVESICFAGDGCRHAHGESELRPKRETAHFTFYNGGKNEAPAPLFITSRIGGSHDALHREGEIGRPIYEGSTRKFEKSNSDCNAVSLMWRKGHHSSSSQEMSSGLPSGFTSAPMPPIASIASSVEGLHEWNFLPSTAAPTTNASIASSPSELSCGFTSQQMEWPADWKAENFDLQALNSCPSVIIFDNRDTLSREGSSTEVTNLACLERAPPPKQHHSGVVEATAAAKDWNAISAENALERMIGKCCGFEQDFISSPSVPADPKVYLDDSSRCENGQFAVSKEIENLVSVEDSLHSATDAAVGMPLLLPSTSVSPSIPNNGSRVGEKSAASQDTPLLSLLSCSACDHLSEGNSSVNLLHARPRATTEFDPSMVLSCAAKRINLDHHLCMPHVMRKGRPDFPTLGEVNCNCFGGRYGLSSISANDALSDVSTDTRLTGWSFSTMSSDKTFIGDFVAKTSEMSS